MLGNSNLKDLRHVTIAVLFLFAFFVLFADKTGYFDRVREPKLNWQEILELYTFTSIL
jgi:hypothetical protein